MKTRVDFRVTLLKLSSEAMVGTCFWHRCEWCVGHKREQRRALERTTHILYGWREEALSRPDVPSCAH